MGTSEWNGASGLTSIGGANGLQFGRKVYNDLIVCKMLNLNGQHVTPVPT